MLEALVILVHTEYLAQAWEKRTFKICQMNESGLSGSNNNT